MAASTLLEVIIAMIIIVVVFTIAMKVFINVAQSGISTTKIKVESRIREIVLGIKARGVVDQESFSEEGIFYSIKVNTTNNNKLSVVEVSALQYDKKIASFRGLILNSHE